jgi:hypothetical protein
LPESKHRTSGATPDPIETPGAPRGGAWADGLRPTLCYGDGADTCAVERVAAIACWSEAGDGDGVTCNGDQMRREQKDDDDDGHGPGIEWPPPVFFLGFLPIPIFWLPSVVSVSKFWRFDFFENKVHMK